MQKTYGNIAEICEKSAKYVRKIAGMCKIPSGILQATAGMCKIVWYVCQQRGWPVIRRRRCQSHQPTGLGGLGSLCLYNILNIIPLGWIYPSPYPLPPGRSWGGPEVESHIFPSKMPSGASSQQACFFDCDFLSFWRHFKVEIWWFFTPQITKQ